MVYVHGPYRSLRYTACGAGLLTADVSIVPVAVDAVPPEKSISATNAPLAAPPLSMEITAAVDGAIRHRSVHTAPRNALNVLRITTVFSV